MSKLQVKESVKLAAQDELSFLNEIDVTEINGKKYIGHDGVPFNVSHTFTETEFVADWLLQFAVGNDNGTNYFNIREWCKYTNMGTLSARVVDDNGETLLIVPPITSNNLTPRQYDALRFGALVVNNRKDDAMRQSLDTNMDVGKMVQTELEKGKRLTLTDMIHHSFYERHGIIPVVEKQTAYVRDEINQQGKTITVDEVKEVRRILYMVRRKEEITDKERNFLINKTRNQFTIPDYVVEKPLNVNQVELPDDPFEC